jgi:hypothetical protein
MRAWRNLPPDLRQTVLRPVAARAEVLHEAFNAAVVELTKAGSELDAVTEDECDA